MDKLFSGHQEHSSNNISRRHTIGSPNLLVAPRLLDDFIHVDTIGIRCHIFTMNNEIDVMFVKHLSNQCDSDGDDAGACGDGDGDDNGDSDGDSDGDGDMDGDGDCDGDYLDVNGIRCPFNYLIDPLASTDSCISLSLIHDSWALVLEDVSI